MQNICVRCVVAVCPCAHFSTKKGSERRLGVVLSLEPHLTKLTVVRLHLQLIRNHPKTLEINQFFIFSQVVNFLLTSFSIFCPYFHAPSVSPCSHCLSIYIYLMPLLVLSSVSPPSSVSPSHFLLSFHLLFFTVLLFFPLSLLSHSHTNVNCHVTYI